MRVNNDHWDIILNFAEKHKEIITNRVTSGLSGRQDLNELWKNLSNQLNSLGFGQKSVLDWKKTLADAKSKLKQKVANINKLRNKTGGGPPDNAQLTERDNRLLALMGIKSIKGDSSLELGLFSKTQLLESENLEPPRKKQVGMIVDSYTVRHYVAEKGNIPNVQLQPNSQEGFFEMSEEDLEEPQCSRPFQNNCDHNYTEQPIREECVEVVIPSPSPVCPQPSIPCPRGSRHRRDKLELSDQIKNMNNETLAVLQNIDQNISNISTDVNRIANALEIISNKHH